MKILKTLQGLNSVAHCAWLRVRGLNVVLMGHCNPLTRRQVSVKSVQFKIVFQSQGVGSVRYATAAGYYKILLSTKVQGLR